MGDISSGAGAAYNKAIANKGREALEVDFTRISHQNPLARRKAESIETQSTAAGFMTGLLQDEYGQPTGFLDAILPFQDDGADELAGSMERIALNQAEAGDFERVRRFHDLASRPKTQWYQAGSIARDSIPFAAEWYVSSKTLGVLGALSQGARGARAAKRLQTVGKGLESLDTPFLTATQRAKQMIASGQNVRGGVLQAVAETPKLFATQTVLGEVFGDSRLRSSMYNDYMRNRYDVVQDSDYGLSVRIADDAYGLWANAMPRALVDGLVETFSESMGHALVHMIPSMKMALTGKGFAKSGTASRMLSFLGLSGDTRYANAWSKFGFSGLVPEMGEEFVGAGIRDVIHKIAPELADEGNVEHLMDNIVPIMAGMALGMFAPAAVTASFNAVDVAIDYKMLNEKRRDQLRGLSKGLRKKVRGFGGIVAIENMLRDGAKAASSMHAAATPELRQVFFESKAAQKVASDRLRERSQDLNYEPTREEVGHEMRALWEEYMRMPLLNKKGRSEALDELLKQTIITEEQRDKYLAEAARRFKELKEAAKSGDLSQLLKDVADMAIDSNAAEAAFEGAAAELQPEAMAAAGQNRADSWVALAQQAASEGASAKSSYTQRYLRAVALRGSGDVQAAVAQSRKVGKAGRQIKRIQQAVDQRVNKLARAMGWSRVRANIAQLPKHGAMARMRNLGVQVVPVTGNTGGKIAWWDGELQMLFVNEAALDAEAKAKGIEPEAQAMRTALHELIHVHVQRLGKSAEAWLRQMDAWLTEAVGPSRISRDKYEDDIEWLEESVADRMEPFANAPNPDAGKRGILRRMAGWVLDELLSWMAPRALMRRRMMRLIDGLNDAGVPTKGASRGQIAMRMATFDLARDILTLRVSDETLKVQLEATTGRKGSKRKQQRKERREEEPGPDWWTVEAGFKIQLLSDDELATILDEEASAAANRLPMSEESRKRLEAHRMSQLALWRRQQAEAAEAGRPGDLETPENLEARGIPVIEYDDLEPIVEEAERTDADMQREVLIDELESMDFEQLYERFLELYEGEPENLNWVDFDGSFEGRNEALRLAIKHLMGLEDLSADTLGQVEQTLSIDLSDEDLMPGRDYIPGAVERRKEAERRREEKLAEGEEQRRAAEERRERRRQQESEERANVRDDLMDMDAEQLSSDETAAAIAPLVEELLKDEFLTEGEDAETLQQFLAPDPSTRTTEGPDIFNLLDLAQALDEAAEQSSDPDFRRDAARFLRKVDRILVAFNEGTLQDEMAASRKRQAPVPVAGEQLEAAAEALRTGGTTSVSRDPEVAEQAAEEPEPEAAPVAKLTAADVVHPFEGGDDALPKFVQWILQKDHADVQPDARNRLIQAVNSGAFDGVTLEIEVVEGSAPFTYMHGFAEYVASRRGEQNRPTVVVTTKKKDAKFARFQTGSSGPQMPAEIAALFGMGEEGDYTHSQVEPATRTPREVDIFRQLVWSDRAARNRYGTGWHHEEKIFGTATDSTIDRYLRSGRGRIIELERRAPGSAADQTHDPEVDRYYHGAEYAYIEQDGTQRLLSTEQLRIPGHYYMPLSGEYSLDDVIGKEVVFKQAVGVKDQVPVRRGTIVNYREYDDSFLVNVDGKRLYVAARNVYDPKYSYRVEGNLPLYDNNGDMILETVVDPDALQELREYAESVRDELAETMDLPDDLSEVMPEQLADVLSMSAEEYLDLRGNMATMRLVPLEGGDTIEVPLGMINPEAQDFAMQQAVVRAIAGTGYKPVQQEAEKWSPREALPRTSEGVEQTVKAAQREEKKGKKGRFGGKGLKRGGRRAKKEQPLLDTLEGAGQKGLAYEMMASLIATDVRVARSLITIRRVQPTAEDPEGGYKVFVDAKRARALRDMDLQGVSLSPYERQLLEADAQGQITDMLKPIEQDLADLLNGRMTMDGIESRLRSIERSIAKAVKRGETVSEDRVARVAGLRMLVTTYNETSGRRLEAVAGVGRETTTNVQQDDGGLRSAEEMAAEEGDVAAVREAEDAIKKKGQPRIAAETFGAKISRQATKELLGEMVSRAMGLAAKPKLIEELEGDPGEAGQITEWWKRWQLRSLQLQDQNSWAALQAMAVLTPRGKAVSDDALTVRDPRGDQDHVSSPLVRIAAMLQWAAVGPVETVGKREMVVGVPLGVMSTAFGEDLVKEMMPDGGFATARGFDQLVNRMPAELDVMEARERSFDTLLEIQNALAAEQFDIVQSLLEENWPDDVAKAFARWRKAYRRKVATKVAAQLAEREKGEKAKVEEEMAQQRQRALRDLRSIHPAFERGTVLGSAADQANVLASMELVLGQMMVEQELLSGARTRETQNLAQDILGQGSLEAAHVLQQQMDDLGQAISEMREGEWGGVLMRLMKQHNDSPLRLRYGARKVAQAGYIANARYLQRDLRKAMVDGADVMITQRGIAPITYVLNPMVVYSPDIEQAVSTNRSQQDMLAMTGGGSPVAMLRQVMLEHMEAASSQHFNLYADLTQAYENGEFEKKLEELRKAKDPGTMSILDTVAELVLQQADFKPSQARESDAFDIDAQLREFYRMEVFEEGTDIVIRGVELPDGSFREMRLQRGEAIVDGTRTRIYKPVANEALTNDAAHYHQMLYRAMHAVKSMESRRITSLPVDERYAYGFDITDMTGSQEYTAGTLQMGVRVSEGEYVSYGGQPSQQFTYYDGPTARPHQPDDLIDMMREEIKELAAETDPTLGAAMEIAEENDRLLAWLTTQSQNPRVRKLLEGFDPATYRVRFQTSRDGLDEFGQPPTEAAKKQALAVSNVWNAENLPQGTDSGWSASLFLKSYDNWLKQTNWFEHLAGRQWRLNRERLLEIAEDTNGEFGDYDKLDAGLQMWVDLTGWMTPGGQRLMRRLIPKKERHRALPKTFDEMWEFFSTRKGSQLTDQHKEVFELARAIEMSPKLIRLRQLGQDIALQARQNTQVALQAKLIEKGQTFYTSLAWVTKEGQTVEQNPQEYGFAESTGAGGPFRQGVGYRALRRQLVGTLEGFSHGLKLRNMSAINTQYRTMRTINEARHNRALLISMERTGIITPKVGNKNKPGMRDLQNIHMKGYEAPEWMAKYLNNAMTQINLRDIENKYFRRYMKATIAAKHMMLSFGFFHHQAFLRSYLFTVRRSDAQKALASDSSLLGIGLASLLSYGRAFGQVSERTLHKQSMGFEPYATGRRAWEEQEPDLKMLIEENLTIQVGGEVTNKMGGAFYTLEDQDDMDEWMQKASARIQKLGMPKASTEAAMRMINGVRKAQRETAFWLFNSMGANLKASAALSEFRELKEQNADKIRPDNDPDGRYVRMLAREAAEKVNADFGGLNMRARTGKVDDLFGKGGPRSAKAQMMLRGLLLAPDWTESNLYTVMASFKRGDTYATPREINDMRRNMYRTMWLRVGSRAMMLQLLGMLFMAGLDDDKDLYDLYCEAGFPGCGDDAAPHWAKFRWLDLNLSALSPSESRKFVSVLGHFGDPIKWTVDLIKDGPFAPIDRKGSVALRSIVEFITGSDYSGRRFTTLSELLGIDQPGVYQRRTRLANGEVRYPGESRGGKYKGQLSRFSVKTGPLRLDQATSYMMTQGLKFVPLQARGLAEYLTGAKDGFDLTAELLGAKYGRTYVKD